MCSSDLLLHFVALHWPSVFAVGRLLADYSKSRAGIQWPRAEMDDSMITHNVNLSEKDGVKQRGASKKIESTRKVAGF